MDWLVIVFYFWMSLGILSAIGVFISRLFWGFDGQKRSFWGLFMGIFFVFLVISVMGMFFSQEEIQRKENKLHCELWLEKYSAQDLSFLVCDNEEIARKMAEDWNYHLQVIKFLQRINK